MYELLLLVGIIAVIVIALGIIVLFISMKKKKEGKYVEPDYRAFFILGICFLTMGTIFMITVSPGFIGFTGLGVIYMIIGLSHRDKWKKT